MPPAGELRVRDITHSTMTLDWDAAPGPVRKYLITYKPESGDAKEVSSSFLSWYYNRCYDQSLPAIAEPLVCYSH